MILLVNAANRAAFPNLLDDLFRARHEVFVELKGWEELRRPDGREIDRWDRQETAYLLVVGQDRVLAGVRIVPVQGETLAGSTLPELFDALAPQSELEASRLFVTPEAGAVAGASPVVGEILLGCLELARLVGGRTLLMAIALPLAETLLSWGVGVEPLGLPRRTRDGMLIVVRIHASALAVRNLRRARAVEDPVLWWADDPDSAPVRVAGVLDVDPGDDRWSPPDHPTPADRATMSPAQLAGIG
jgi:acyl-homoserine lactone synthase